MLLPAKEIINKSFELFKRDFRIWLTYIAINFVFALLGYFLVFNDQVLLFFATLGISPIVVVGINMIFLLALTALNIWLQITLIRTIHTRLFNQEVSGLKQQFSASRHLLARGVGVSLLVALVVSLPLILGAVGLSITGFENLVAGNIKEAGLLYVLFGLLMVYGIFHGIYFSIKYTLSLYVVALDEKHVRESLHEGSKLVSGRMLSVLWRLAAPIILFILAYILANYILTTLSNYLNQVVVTVTVGIISLVVSALTALLCVISSVIVYEDVKAKPVEVAPVKKD